MEFKIGFLLIVILIGLVSIGITSANENSTELGDESQVVDENCLQMIDNFHSNNNFDNDDESQVVDENTLGMVKQPELIESSYDDVELYVKISNDHDDDFSVFAGDAITWKITVMSKGGTALNTKLYTSFKNVKYIKHHAGAGSYNKNTGLWKVGDLSPNKEKSLFIKTKAADKGRIIFKSIAITSSNHEYSLHDFYDSNSDIYKLHIVNLNHVSGPLSNDSSSAVTGSRDLANHHQKHEFSSEKSRSSSFYESSQTGSFYASAKAYSSSKSIDNDSNMNVSESENLKILNNSSSKDYDEPFSISKVATYLLENKFLLSIIILLFIALTGVTYYKSK